MGRARFVNSTRAFVCSGADHRARAVLPPAYDGHEIE